jgi:hypothetical protein
MKFNSSTAHTLNHTEREKQSSIKGDEKQEIYSNVNVKRIMYIFYIFSLSLTSCFLKMKMPTMEIKRVMLLAFMYLRNKIEVKMCVSERQQKIYRVHYNGLHACLNS